MVKTLCTKPYQLYWNVEHVLGKQRKLKGAKQGVTAM